MQRRVVILGVPAHAQSARLETVEAASHCLAERRLIDGLETRVLTVVQVHAVHGTTWHADAITKLVVFQQPASIKAL